MAPKGSPLSEDNPLANLISKLPPRTPAKEKKKQKILPTSRRLIADSDDEDSQSAEPLPTSSKKRKRGEPKQSKKEKAVTDADLGDTLTKAYQKRLPDLESARKEKINTLTDNGKKALKGALPTRGVRIVSITTTTENTGAIAGYLNFFTGPQINVLAKPVIEVVYLMKKKSDANWGYDRSAGQKTVSFRVDAFFGRLASKEITADDITINEPNAFEDHTRFPKTGENKSRLYLRLLQWCKLVFDAADELEKDGKLQKIFTGPAPGQPRVQLIDGLDWDSEDIFRAIVLLFFLMRKIKGTDSDELPRINSCDPQLPIFATASSAATATEAELKKYAEDIDYLIEADRLGLNEGEMMEELRKSVRVADDVGAEGADKVVGSAPLFSSKGIQGQTDDIRKKNIAMVTRTLQYLYKDTAHQNKLFFDVADNGDVQRALEKAADQQRYLIVDSAGEKKKTTTANVDEAHKKFLALQNSMTKGFAASAPFDEVGGSLGLDITTDLKEPDPISGQNFRIEFRGLALKPQQPGAIHWMTEMLISDIGSCILADDVGLGKTVEVLATICRLVEIKEAEMKVWATYAREVIERLRKMNAQYKNVSDKDIWNNVKQVREHIWSRKGLSPTYRPVVVVVPPHALMSWLGDWKKFFRKQDSPLNIEVRTLCSLGGKKSNVEERARAIKGGVKGLNDFLAGLDASDPQTGRTIILTTYQSWQAVVLDRNVVHKKTKPRAQRRSSDEQDQEQQEEDVAMDEGQEQDEQEEVCPEEMEEIDVDEDDDNIDPLGHDNRNPDQDVDIDDDAPTKRGHGLRVPADAFEGFVMDEAHKVMDSQSLQSEACAFFLKCWFCMVTATPIKNKLTDFAGLLRFPWQNIFPLIPVDAVALNRASYPGLARDLSEKYDSRVMNIKDKQKRLGYLQALNPATFKKFVTTNTVTGTTDISGGSDVLPLPQAMLVLRRVKGSILELLGVKYVIGSDIPPTKVYNLETRQGAYERQLFLAAHESTNAMNTEAVVLLDNENETVSRTGGNLKRRRLQLASANPALDVFSVRKVDVNANFVNKLVSGEIDALLWYHTRTKGDFHGFVPTHPAGILQWVVGTSAKLQALCQIIGKHVIEEKEKLIIWANEPLTIFMVELVLLALDLKFASIRSGVKAQTRNKAVNDYNNDPELMILVCSSRSAQESMNLQQGGHVMAFLDVVSLQAVAQMLGRQSRIGQLLPVIAYLLNNDETFDQVLQALFHERHRSLVAAQTQITRAHAAFLINNLTEDQKMTMEHAINSDENLTQEKYVLEKLITTYADATTRNMYGIKSMRTESWKSMDFKKKNLDPEEAIRRMALGGQLGAQVAFELEKVYFNASDEPEGKEKTPEIEEDDREAGHKAVAPPPPRMEFAQARIPDANYEEPRIEHTTMFLHEKAKELARDFAYSSNKITPLEILRMAYEEWTPANPGPSDHIKAAYKAALDAPDMLNVYAAPATFTTPLASSPPKSSDRKRKRVSEDQGDVSPSESESNPEEDDDDDDKKSNATTDPDGWVPPDLRGGESPPSKRLRRDSSQSVDVPDLGEDDFNLAGDGLEDDFNDLGAAFGRPADSFFGQGDSLDTGMDFESALRSPSLPAAIQQDPTDKIDLDRRSEIKDESFKAEKAPTVTPTPPLVESALALPELVRGTTTSAEVSAPITPDQISTPAADLVPPEDVPATTGEALKCVVPTILQPEGAQTPTAVDGSEATPVEHQPAAVVERKTTPVMEQEIDLAGDGQTRGDHPSAAVERKTPPVVEDGMAADEKDTEIAGDEGQSGVVSEAALRRFGVFANHAARKGEVVKLLQQNGAVDVNDTDSRNTLNQQLVDLFAHNMRQNPEWVPSTEGVAAKQDAAWPSLSE